MLVICVAQRAAHITELRELRFQHNEERTAAEKAYAELLAEKEALEARRAKENALSKKVVTRLQAEVDALSQTNSNMERQLRETKRTFSEETVTMRSQWTSQVSKLSQTSEQQRQDLNREVQRLRSVQEQVLATKGAEALSGEARRMLFYESLKTKSTQPLQPAQTISWRGQEQPLPPPTSPQELAARIEKMRAEMT